MSAQYRFLVKPTGDYTAYFADADIYLNWGDVLSVLIPTSSALSGASSSSSSSSALSISPQPSLETHEGAACPICLSPPTAPRMTKCGHVYCYPCILQYLATNDEPSNAGTPSSVPGASAGANVSSVAHHAVQGPSNRQWKRCPICWDAVYARDLKAVKWWDPKAIAQETRTRKEQDGLTPPPTSSSSPPPPTLPPGWIRMRLIERPQITTLALPQSSTWPTSSTSPSDQPLIAQHQAPWHFQPDVMTYCKFMLATPELLLESLTQDVDELAAEKSLLQSLGAKPGDNSVAFADLAERKVREQMTKVVNELDTPAVRSAIGQAQNDLREHADAEEHKQVRDNENLSRRQRRQREREREVQSHRGDGTDSVSAGDSVDAGVSTTAEAPAPTSTPDVADAPESTQGAEAFLALKSAGQGGSYGGGQTPAAKSQDDAAGADAAPAPAAVTPLDTGKPVKTHHTKPKRNLNPPAPSASSYLFYQSASGQNIFLHPLDIKIMLSQFEVYARFPREIAVKIQSAEEGSMNEELRKRCKYLTHLPKATDIVFIEVDWDAMASRGGEGASKEESSSTPPTAPLVEASTLRQYEQILRARRNKRRDRERKEDRAKARAEQAEAASRPGGGGGGGGGGGPNGGRRRQSVTSSSDGVGHALAGGATASSPTFMEAALWGAEREFPTHEGVYEDFPVAAPAGPPARPSPPLSATTSNRARKTVWGTPAAEASSFSSTLHASSRRAQEDWRDDDIDDAWLELEEGFVLGTNNARQVRAGRGLNSGGGGGGGGGGHRGASASSRQKSASSAANGGAQQQPPPPTPKPEASSSISDEGVASTATDAPPPATAAKGQGKKQRKAKLVLTSGGRGTG